MGGAIPAWGLYRLLKAVENRRVDGVLDLHVMGTLSLCLRGGTPLAAACTHESLSFEHFVAAVRPQTRVRTPCELLSTGVPREEAARLQAAHLRAVLKAVMPLPVANWDIRPGVQPDWALAGQGADMTATLMEVVAEFKDIEWMRKALTRYREGGFLSLAEGAEPLLSAAKTIADAKVLYLLRQGKSHQVGEGVLSSDENVRVLFALLVAGALVRDGSGAFGLEAEHEQDSPGLATLRTAAKEMMARNLYEVLGVGLDARVSAVESAYRRARRRFSPKRFEDAGPAGQPLLEQVLARVEEARTTLTDRTLRLSYNRAIGESAAALDARISEIFDARALYRTGMDLLAGRRYDEAMAQFEAAAARDPLEPEYLTAIASILVSKGPNQPQLERARALAEQALKADPELVPAIVVLASICRLENKQEEALELARQALRIDPDSKEAMGIRDLLQPSLRGTKISFVKKRESILDRLRNLLRSGLRRNRS